MQNFIMIPICILTGMFMARRKMVPSNTHKGINAWVLYIALPALALRYVPYIEWGRDILMPLVSPIIVWFGALVFIGIYSRIFKLDRATKTAMFITCALGNTAFLGFPMVVAYFGSEQLAVALIFDQVTFFFFSILGVATVMKASAPPGMKGIYMNAALKTLKFPPFIGCVAGLILGQLMRIQLLPDLSFINPLLDLFVATVSPMALFSIGLQLKTSSFKSESRNVLAGVGYKLMIAPLLVLLFAVISGISGNQAKVSVLQSAMPSHVTVSLIAAENNLNPEYCTLVVGVGIAFSFVTTFLWYLVSMWLL